MLVIPLLTEGETGIPQAPVLHQFQWLEGTSKEPKDSHLLDREQPEQFSNPLYNPEKSVCNTLRKL